MIAASPTKPHSSPMLLAMKSLYGIRQEAGLLAALAESDAERAARSDRDERLLELIVHRRRRAARIEKGRHAQERVLQPLDLVPEHGNGQGA